MKCKKCNNAITEDTKFCSCGENVENVSSQTHPTFENQDADKKEKKDRPWVTQTLGFIAVVAVGVIWNVFFNNDYVDFQKPEARYDIRVILPSGWELSRDTTYISSRTCQVSTPILESIDEIYEVLEELDVESEAETIRINRRDWTKRELTFGNDQIRILYLETHDMVYMVEFQARARNFEACERDFNRIENSVRLRR